MQGVGIWAWLEPTNINRAPAQKAQSESCLHLRGEALCHLLRNQTQEGLALSCWVFVFCYRLIMAVSSSPCLQPQIKVSQPPLRFSLALPINSYDWCYSRRWPDFVSVFNFASFATKLYSGLKLQSACEPLPAIILPFLFMMSSLCPLLNHLSLLFVFPNFKVRLEEQNLILL